MTVSLQVQDLNDNSPTFSQETYFAVIEKASNENVKAPQAIATFHVQDKDMGIYGLSGLNCFLMGDGAERLVLAVFVNAAFFKLKT